MRVGIPAVLTALIGLGCATGSPRYPRVFVEGVGDPQLDLSVIDAYACSSHEDRYFVVFVGEAEYRNGGVRDILLQSGDLFDYVYPAFAREAETLLRDGMDFDFGPPWSIVRPDQKQTRLGPGERITGRIRLRAIVSKQGESQSQPSALAVGASYYMSAWPRDLSVVLGTEVRKLILVSRPVRVTIERNLRPGLPEECEREP